VRAASRRRLPHARDPPCRGHRAGGPRPATRFSRTLASTRPASA